MMKRSAVAVLVLSVMLWRPATASAGWFVGLNAGKVFGGALTESLLTFTGQVGVVSEHGPFGFEIDFGYHEQLEDVGTRSITSSLLIGPTFGHWRPYGSIGGGIIGAVTSATDVFKIGGQRPNDGVVTFGGGLMGKLSERLGLRFDVRRFVDTNASATVDTKDGPQSVDVPRFKFTRLTVGVYLTF